MQSLIKYPKQQYVVSKRLVRSFPKCTYQRNGIVNIARTKGSFNSEVNRLRFPVSHSLCVKVYKELNALRSSLLKNGSSRIYCSPKLLLTRNFSTTPYFSNKNKPAGPSKGSSENPNTDPNDPEDPNGSLIMCIKGLILLSSAILLYFVFKTGRLTPTPWGPNVFNWDEFVNEMLLKGEVEKIIIFDSNITVILRPNAIYKGKELRRKVFSLNDSTYAKVMEEKIREIERNIGIRSEDGIPIEYINSSSVPTFTIVCTFLLLLLMLHFLSRQHVKLFRNPIDLFTQKSRANYTLVEPFSGKGVRFEDVAGLKEAKIEVMEFVDYLKHSRRYSKLGAKVPKGALLLGPPGCGKTLLAKAVATEANVPFLSMNGSEFIEILGGLGAARVRSLFAAAKKRAPSIIYIDEIDAVGRKRSHESIEFSNDESERTLNQLLVEMDGMTTAEDVIILASTNRPEVLDIALLRRGRFDRHILIDLPTMDERKDIFELYLKSLSLQGKPEQYSGILSQLTPGFSGADIGNVCNEAALHAARNKSTAVTNNDLMYAIDRTLGGASKKSSSISLPTRNVVAHHEAGHALTGWLLEHTDVLLKVTIIPRVNLRLGFSQYLPLDSKLRTKEQLFQKMCMMLGGRVAESLIFNKISTGAEDDLKKVTDLAYRQVQQFGMCSTVGLVSFRPDMLETSTKKPYSKKLANLMDAEVRKLIVEAYKTTEKLLLDNKDKLTAIAEALLERETLTYDDVQALIGPPSFQKKRATETQPV